MKRTILIVTAFALFFAVWYFNLGVRPLKAFVSDSVSAHYILNYLTAGIIPLAALCLLHGWKAVAGSMGLSRGLGTGALFGLLTTLPMLAGYAFLGAPNRSSSADELFCWIVVAGFFEEVFFRGFVFGQLFRYAHWGFLPAALLTAAAFGSLHLYQGSNLVSSLGAFAVTAAGSIFFSWIYVEWNYNLWCAVWLHILMNLPWIAFRISSSGAVGDMQANGLRICTVFLAAALTASYKKRRGLPYFINAKTLIINA